MSWTRRATGTALAVAALVVGKVLQLASVEYLGARLGFNGASLLVLIPYLALLVVAFRQLRRPRPA